MKKSIQLLIGLLLVVVAGLYFAKYQLKSQYEKIDKTDSFYAFDKVNNIKFSHVKINGGNLEHVFIEPGKSPELYIRKNQRDAVSYEIVKDTLIIQFTNEYTASENFENYWGSRVGASVILQYNRLKSVSAVDASVSVNLEKHTSFKSEISGITNLELTQLDESLKDLRMASDNNSKYRINEYGEATDLKIFALNLKGSSLAEIYNLKSDSTSFDFDPDCRISANAFFLNK